MLLNILTTTFILNSAALLANGELVSFEPIQYIKSHLSSVKESSIWNVLYEASPQQVSEMSSSLKKTFHSLLRGTETNIVFSKGDRIISKYLSSKTKSEDKTKIPPANLISILSVSITILLENFQSKVISEPIGKILKGEDLSSTVIKQHKSYALLEILNMLSSGPMEASVLDSKTLLNELNKHGEVALFFVNSVLGNTANEAWMDALLAFDVNNQITDSYQLELSMHNLFQYLLTVIHDFHMLNKATGMNIPILDQRYMFGWWLNCPITLNDCIIPELPEDLIFSISPTLRVYISPSLELSLIIADANTRVETLHDVISIDKSIWNPIHSVLSHDTESTVIPESEAINTTTNINTNYTVDLVYRVWPILLFFFWVISSHIWVYWMFHCCWFVATSMSKRAQILRPKVASNN